ncbi:HYD1 signature containing ADP-ribosyltransferase family protein [Paenarthrobacter sp. NPDC056912]|uniref:HYD1 signature containing ADP-ribosyltransferase family protein n=1 Tax=Paenarthrobacter sp. NPDC056912 TaxID=3345965 RepID=UPI00366D8A54
MSIFSSLMRSKPRAAITGVVSAAVIASGAGFIYITAPWSSPDAVSDVKPVPVQQWTPEADTSAQHQIVENPEANGTGRTIDGIGTDALPSVTPSAQADPAAVSGPAGTRSVPIQPINAAPASVPMAPVPGNDKGSGDFTALPGTSSGSWGVAGQTGAFTWSYPFALRDAPAGPTPALGISYDSSRVDGLTSSTNNQASPVGDGWALTGGGQVQQKFGSCMDQGVANSYDLCGNPGGQQFTISFGGRSGLVIRDATTGLYKLQNDDNTKLEYLTGAANGTFDGGYWKITDTSGVQYWFGVNRIPGWSAGKDNYSADIVPVYGLPGQPCYNSAGFGSSSCMQAYAWNLDYVVDPNGNSQGFFYTQDTNFYKSQAGTGTLKAYHRASRLARVDYGMRAGTELSTQAPLHVNFGYTGRCEGVTGCPTPNGDVPAEFACASTGTCTTYSPTFFTYYRLQTVISQSLSVNPAGYGDTDFWTFGHAMPDPGDGTKPALWLGSLIHQGSNQTSSTGGWVDDPAVVFKGQTLHNRVWAVDGLAPFDRYRLSTIETATGASIQVTYKASDCSQTSLPASAETNTKRCFPQRWTPTTPIAQPARTDHFNIYPVETVVSKGGPGSTGSLDSVTSYGYIGTPAWKYAAPKYVSGTAGQNITWSSLAGWSQVKTKVGTAASNPTTVTTYLRGLNGTPSNTTGGLRADIITLSDGSAVPDSVWFAGQEVEKQSYAGDGGTLLGTSITVPWASAPTATGTVATGAAQARHTGTTSVTKKTATSKSASMRVSVTSMAYDAYGRPIRTSSTGEQSAAGDESCEVTGYADNTTSNILSLPATVDTYEGVCSGTGPNGNLLKATRNLYDASTSAIPGSAGYTAPIKGNLARSDNATAVSGTTVTTWAQGPTVTFDALGRESNSRDNSTGTARDTTTAYTPATGLPTKVTQTNPMGWISTIALDSMRGQPLTKTDPNGKITSYRYDNAGRVTGEWDPMRPAASNPTPTVETSYSISKTNPSWVKTVTIAGDGTPMSSYVLYDGLGRERQTQKMSPGGGTIVTDTWYDSRGAKSTVNNNYFISNAPDGVLRVPALAVPSSTIYEYDAARRPTKIRTMTNENQELWATQIAYTGMDTTTVTGPGTESAVKTIVNLDGNIESRSLFHGTAPSGAADTSTYIYDAQGQLTRMGDGANLWTWTYDAAGRETSAVDPDAGTRSTTYDAAGRTATTTDAMGTVTSYVYDKLDRTTAKNVSVGGATAKTLESHVYDLEMKGLPSSSTRNNGAGIDQPVTTAFSGYNDAYQPSTTTITLPSTLTGLSGSYTTTRSYSTSGQVTGAVTPAIGGLPAETVKYGYDGFENPSSTWNTAGDQFAGAAQYDHLGFLTQYTQYDVATLTESPGNMTGTNKTYFSWSASTGRLNEQWTTNTTRGAVADLGKTRYTYNEAGKLSSRELAFSSRPGVASDYQCYDYDYASRLEAVWTPLAKTCTTVPAPASPSVTGLGGPAPYAQTYTYTAAGDRSEVRRFDASGALTAKEQYSYAAPGTAGPHQVDTITSTAAGATPWNFTWDAAGRMTGRAGQTMTYTPDGLLATTTGTSAVPANPNPGAGAGTPPAPTTGAGSLSTRYYDAAGNLVGLTDGSGTTVTLGSVTAHATKAATPVKTATCTYTFAGKTVAQRTAAAGVVKLSLIVGDSVNTAQTMTQPTVGAGAITAVQRYTDPYGLARGANLTGTGNGTYTAATATTAGVGSNAANGTGFSAANGFIGGLDDTISSLTHLGARELDPVTGAFTTADPVLHTDKSEGFTPYSYAWGDPINRADPSGLDWFGDIGNFFKDHGSEIVGAVTGAVVGAIITVGIVGLATGCAATIVCGLIAAGALIGGAVAGAIATSGATAMADMAQGKPAPSAQDYYGGMGENIGWGLVGAPAGAFGGKVLSKVAPYVGSFVRGLAGNGGGAAASAASARVASQNLAKQSYQAAQQQTKTLGNQAAAKAATAPAASGSGSGSLYHYTDEAGMKGILGSKQLRPSLSSVNPKDARYGNGQYLSDIGPGTKTCAQLSRCFLGMPFQPQRFSNFVEVDVAGLNVVKGRDAVFVVPGETDLDLTGRILSWGANEAK